MGQLAQVTIHSSQFPEQIRADLVQSLRLRQVNHKFHYLSLKQTQQWLALHEAVSPARNDPDCATKYDRSFQTVATRIESKNVLLIGLGCGGGQKDVALIKLLKGAGREVSYIPCDVGLPMVLVARKAALELIPETNCFPLVCDMATADDLPQHIERLQSSAGPVSPLQTSNRLLTFFGLIPNFEPETILPRLAGLVRSADQFLFSANLAPGPEYTAGVERILPQYDNDLTRAWLFTFLEDLGVKPCDGVLRFKIEDGLGSPKLKRVAAYFDFARPCRLEVDEEQFEFGPGETIRLFFSYRYTPGLVREWLARYGLVVEDEWITKSEEEGVFLVSRSPD
jgi:uncharacterized SAM-dependent methyltransferase